MKTVFCVCVHILILLFNVCHAEQTHVPLYETKTINVSQHEIDDLWKFVKEITETPDMPPPRIYFVSFNGSIAGEAWRAWQRKWVKGMRIQEDPLWWQFDGFSYKGTGVIQVNPHLFLQKSTPGSLLPFLRHDGNFVVAHEMLHYVFEIKGVPSFLEHCIMDAGGFQDAIVTHIYGAHEYGMSLRGICESTPQILIRGGIEQALKAPLHNKYFK